MDLGETLLQAAHCELGEELSPYGPDLRDKVEAAMSASPNGHTVGSGWNYRHTAIARS